MPPLTQEQTTAIQNANQNATVNADAILTPPATPRLPTITPPEPPVTQPFDINQYVTPPQQADNTQLEQQTNSVFEQLLGAQDQAATQGARLTALEQQAGIPQLTIDLADIQNQINKKELDFRRQQEAIVNNPGISTAAQRNAELADVSRKQASELADLEVIRAARTNSLNAIQSIIDRKVQREFADESRRIENLKFIYDQRKGDLTKAQDRQYQQMITREERAYNLAKSKYEQVENAKGELIKNAQLNGANTATLQKIMAAKDLAGAYAAAGNFGLSIDDKIKKAQLDKIKNAQDSTPEASDMDKDVDFRKLKGVSELRSTLKAYDNLVKQYGAQRVGRANAAILDNAYQEVLQAYRAAKDLGALQGADLALVDDAIKRATFEKTTAGKIINVPLLGIPSAVKRGVTKRGAEASIGEAYNSIERASERLTGIISSKNPKWINTSYFQAVSGLSKDVKLEFDENGNVVIPGETSDEDFWGNNN